MAIACSFLIPTTPRTRLRPRNNILCSVQNVEELKTHGVTFTSLGNSRVLRMALENGTSAKLMLPSGLITSFKPEMWHGATLELLHTTVSSSAAIQGGLSLSLALSLDKTQQWSSNDWALQEVNGNPENSIQVKLTSTAQDGDAQVNHILTLGRDSLNSEVVVTNLTASSTFRITGSSLCHLAASTPDAIYALGLQGSDFFTRPPFAGDFSIVPPRVNRDVGKLWPFNKLSTDEEEVVESEEEKDNYKHLTKRLSGIYTSAPRHLTIIDRGRRNSVSVKRSGFKELYMFSPGSEHEWYSKYSYICIGHAALLEPIILNPQSEWRGGLQLWNPNS
ncbi:hypothetical protein CASFOL_024595 [Castilleja foliolosa]|uniref:Protein NDH-DEPENDENT CYCLIC ELECTRON FLOW 5 n=1 Tax=Castilleja foliolosa TaxID=1961234 RepID=A0ABD3CNS5_9LAMI